MVNDLLFGNALERLATVAYVATLLYIEQRVKFTRVL